MAESSSQSLVYSKNTLEFLAVAKSYCDVLENPEQLEKDKLLEILLRLLPLLYLKGSLLPEVEPIDEEGLETYATEMQYSLLAGSLAALFGEDDAYLEVYHPDIALADGAFAASAQSVYRSAGNVRFCRSVPSGLRRCHVRRSLQLQGAFCTGMGSRSVTCVKGFARHQV